MSAAAEWADCPDCGHRHRLWCDGMCDCCDSIERERATQ